MKMILIIINLIQNLLVVTSTKNLKHLNKMKTHKKEKKNCQIIGND